MIPLSHGLSIPIILFILGLTGMIIRRNLFCMLLGLEIALNASALAFIIAGSYLEKEDGQIMYILTITVAAAESAVALALLLQLYRRSCTLNIDSISKMRG